MRYNMFLIQATRVFYWSVWIGVHVALFASQFISLQTNPKLTQFRGVLGNSLLVARASTICLNFDCMLLLIPVCRNIISLIRGTFLNRIVPFDKNITFHKITAWTMNFWTVVHVGAHYFNYLRLQNFSNGILSGPGMEPIPPLNYTVFAPLPPKLTAFDFAMTTISGYTGHIMVLIQLIMISASLEPIRRQYFELFWYLHHLFIFWYALLMLHGTGCLIKFDDFSCPGAQAYKWTLGSVGLYLFERILREYRGRQLCYVTKVIAHPSKVVEIQFKKPSMVSKPGQYVFINLPEISTLEWHPFTMTSAPEEDFFSVHIRVVGDWTTKMATRLGCISDSKGGKEKDVGNTKWRLPRLRVDGPFGTASEDVFDYEAAVLVGAGIGVTPFASILKSVWYHIINPEFHIRLRKVYFYWICRERDAFEWFQDLLVALEEEDYDNLLEIHVYLTGTIKENEYGNIFINDTDGYDPITNLRAPTRYGRPNWDQSFETIKKMHAGSSTSGPTKIGVFFCGPKVLSSQIHKAADRASDAGAVFHYNKENF